MHIIFQHFGLGQAVLRPFIIKLIYNGDCLKCSKCYYSVSFFGKKMKKSLTKKYYCGINKWLLPSHGGDCFKSYFIILYGSYMQCSVLFNVMFVIIALFCITVEQN